MNSMCYTLEMYEVNPQYLTPKERYEVGCIIRVLPTQSELYCHGSKGNNVYSRALRSIEADRIPLLPDDKPIVCWQALNCALKFDANKETLKTMLERILTSSEQAIVLKKLKANSLSEFLDERSKKRSDLRSKCTHVFDETLLPETGFTVTTRVWVEPQFLETAKKLSELVMHLNSHFFASFSMPEHSCKDAPSIQLERKHSSRVSYVKNLQTEDLAEDSLFDFFIHSIAYKYTRNYWHASP
jgi:hypothetical protein